MSLVTQAKVLRVLQEMEFERVGGSETIHVDVRVIAATNKDLKKEIEAGNFREDLFYRLNVIPIHVPPLRERREDIVPLVDYYLEYFARANNKLPKVFSKKVYTLFLGYGWPGNVRELRNMVERICIMIRKETVDHDDVLGFFSGNGEIAGGREDREYATLKDAREDFERQYIREKLLENNITSARPPRSWASSGATCTKRSTVWGSGSAKTIDKVTWV
jgi:two-component system nitrogen regulation response regulator NtrX